MKIVAVYNMKGGVGKTTTAVNLSSRAAASGSRTLLWDLDPQAAASFAFRVRPKVEGFDKDSLTDGRALKAAIRATDCEGLDILPAAFAYRKFERFLDGIGKPDRVVPSLVREIGNDYDIVFLDCPAGFSLLIEGLFVAANLVVVPTLPTVLSLRTIVQLLKWANRSEATLDLAAFMNMVDRRKTLHRRVSELVADSRRAFDIFMEAQIPYASTVEQMAVRRAPLSVFAPSEAATAAFETLGLEIDRRLHASAEQADASVRRWAERLAVVDAMTKQLDATSAVADARQGAGSSGPPIVHTFDTSGRDLEANDLALALHEGDGRFVVTLARTKPSGSTDSHGLRAQIDRKWAVDILSGMLSPLVALERRLGRAGLVGDANTITQSRAILRIASELAPAPPLAAPHLSIVRKAG